MNTARSLRFTRASRLLSGPQYTAVFNNTVVRIQLPHFLVLATPNTLSFPRLGCVVAKKHIKKATVRNLIKRQIRETFRFHQHLLMAYDIVVVLKSGIKNSTSVEVRRELLTVWQKQKLHQLKRVDNQ